MADGPSQYKSSSEQERIARQLDRDLGRASAKRELSEGGLTRSRLSQSTRRALDDPETKDWVRSIINQKSAQAGANNFSQDRTTVRVSQTSKESPYVPEDGSQSSVSAQASGGYDEDAMGGGGNGGGGSLTTCIGLALYNKTATTTNPETGETASTRQVWINAGTVAGDPQDEKLIASSGSGEVWIKIEINETNGSITSRKIESGSIIPVSTNTSFYYPLGNYNYSETTPTVTNYGCGSVEVQVCRNWFSVEAPFYGVTFYR
jgi:hypothetical protein